MDQALIFMNVLSLFLTPLANAADTTGMYTIVPKTITNLMSNPYVQYFVLYYFLVATGAEPQYALLFVMGMAILLFLEKNNFIYAE